LRRVGQEREPFVEREATLAEYRQVHVGPGRRFSAGHAPEDDCGHEVIDEGEALADAGQAGLEVGGEGDGAVHREREYITTSICNPTA
jgi:hypothetical protein